MKFKGVGYDVEQTITGEVKGNVQKAKRVSSMHPDQPTGPSPTHPSNPISLSHTSYRRSLITWCPRDLYGSHG